MKKYMESRTDSLLNADDLRYLKEELVEPKRAETLVRQLMTVNDEANWFVESIGFDKLERSGQGAKLSTEAENIPLVNNNRSRTTRKVVDYYAGYRYSEVEIERARALGVGLETRLLDESRFQIRKQEQTLVFNGFSPANIEGIYNWTGRQDVSLDNGSWSTASATELRDDLNELADYLDLLDGYEARRLLLHPNDLTHLKNNYFTNSDQTSVLSWAEDEGLFPDGIEKSTYFTEGTAVVLDSRPVNMEINLPQPVEDPSRGMLDPFMESPTKVIVGLRERAAGFNAFFANAVVTATNI